MYNCQYHVIAGGWSPTELLTHNRLSVGFGLLFNIGMGRVELNYCIPLKAQSHDRYSHHCNSVTYLGLPHNRLLPGLQLGVGIEFL